MGPRALAAVAVVAMPACLSKPEPPGGGKGWLAGYAYRKPITVQPDADLADFPVSVLATSDPDLAMFADDGGGDLVFTANDGQTVLDRDLVRFDGTTGALDAWVQVPALAAPSTALYLYYGGPPVASDDAAAWTGYEAVWHMAATTDTEPDVTGHGHDVVAMAGEEPAADLGIIGGARRYDGAERMCAAVVGVPLVGSGSFTVSLVLNPGLGNEYATPFETGGGTPTIRGYGLELGTGPWDVNFADGTSQVLLRIDKPASLVGTWLQIVAIADREAQIARLYVNGEQIRSESIAQLGSVTGSRAMCLGGFYHYTGLLDEARLMLSAASPDQVFAEYANLLARSSFITIGAAETAE